MPEKSTPEASGWPEGVQPPSVEEVEEAVRKGQKLLHELLEELSGRNKSTEPPHLHDDTVGACVH